MSTVIRISGIRDADYSTGHEDGDVTFKQMADYSLVIADASSILRLDCCWKIHSRTISSAGAIVLIKPSLEPVSTVPKSAGMRR